MDIDSDFQKINIKSQEEGGGAPIPMDSEDSSTIQNKGKEDEELTDSMKKLQVEESSSGQSGSNFKRKPVIIIVVGMAGSGKTTFMQQLVSHTRESDIRGYVMNLDPAVMTLPFGANIDIRDTVRYKEVMKQFNLGPNGGILTSLNLFATKFDEVVSVIEKRAHQLDYVLVDTPGQIEIFTWSASGAIITEAFASTFPTVIAYVVDTPRSASPVTFMSNMLYACSILYKTRLPLVLAFNKIDVAQHQFALEWMEDFETFQAAVSADSSYSSNLAQSLSLVLDEFYKNLRSVGVSAVSGAGMKDFFKAVEASAEEYMDSYKADLDKRRAEKQRLEEEHRKENMEKLRKDMEKSGGETVVLSTGLKDKGERGKAMMDEDEEDQVEEEDEMFTEGDDSFDAWNDFTSSNNASNLADSSVKQSNNQTTPVDHTSEVNLFGAASNSGDLDFGSFLQPDLSAGAFNSSSGSTVVDGAQPEPSVLDRLADASTNKGKKSEDVAGGGDVSSAGAGSKSDDVERIMSQMHDLSFMLESTLSMPPKQDELHPPSKD